MISVYTKKWYLNVTFLCQSRHSGTPWMMWSPAEFTCCWSGCPESLTCPDWSRLDYFIRYFIIIYLFYDLYEEHVLKIFISLTWKNFERGEDQYIRWWMTRRDLRSAVGGFGVMNLLKLMISLPLKGTVFMSRSYERLQNADSTKSADYLPGSSPLRILCFRLHLCLVCLKYSRKLCKDHRTNYNETRRKDVV